jgi:hypothetical protein
MRARSSVEGMKFESLIKKRTSLGGGVKGLNEALNPGRFYFMR